MTRWTRQAWARVRFQIPGQILLSCHGDRTMMTLNERQDMGLIDYLKTQLLEIIQWEDDSRDTISWRYPDEDKEIKRGAQLIVRESQTCQFVYLGQFGDTFG